MDKVTSLGERLKIGGSEVGRKMMNFFQGPNQADMIVEEATSQSLHQPDWSTTLEICDLINHERLNFVDFIRAVNNRIVSKSPRIQFLALFLLETVVNNCDKPLSEVASQRVLDEMLKLIDDPQTVVNNRNKALMLIQSWGDSSNEPTYFPVFQQTYKCLMSRGIRFPERDDESLIPIFTPPSSVSEVQANAALAQRDVHVQSFSAGDTKKTFDVTRNTVELLSTVLSPSPQQDVTQDDLTTTLVQQCRQAQSTIQRIIETAGDNEAVLFEALNVNDEVLKVLSKYEDMKKPSTVPAAPGPTLIPVVMEP